jgi:hypothetical protein
MSFVEVVFGLILTAFSLKMQGNVTDDDKMRLHGVAQDIWAAADALPDNRQPFQGEAGKEASAVALVTVSFHESGFWSKVQDCSICFPGSAWCDRGRSVSLFQLREGSSSWGAYTRAELCEDNAKAAERAMVVLSRHRRSPLPVTLFDAYARGGAGIKPGQAALEMSRYFDQFSKKAGIRVSYKNGAMQATWAPGRKPVDTVDAAISQNP